jgi:hypothetical protein
MVGCVVRFAQDSSVQEIPTGLTGASPFFLERTISAYTDGQTLTLDQDPQMSLSGVKYSISDPVDIEPGAMLTYFLREVEKQVRIARKMKPMEVEEIQYRDAQLSAFEMDNRHYAEASEYGTYWPRDVWAGPITAEVG